MKYAIIALLLLLCVSFVSAQGQQKEGLDNALEQLRERIEAHNESMGLQIAQGELLQNMEQYRERLELRNCSNCTYEIEQDGNRFEVRELEQKRFLGLFRVQSSQTFEFDDEGNVVNHRRNFWRVMENVGLVR